jgi:hypothetical protein
MDKYDGEERGFRGTCDQHEERFRAECGRHYVFYDDFVCDKRDEEFCNAGDVGCFTMIWIVGYGRPVGM